jgi:hypothetical protein
MEKRSVGTQRRLAVYLSKLYKEGYNFQGESNYK